MKDLDISRKKLLLFAFLTECGVCLTAVVLAWIYDIKFFNVNEHYSTDILWGTLWAIPLALFFASSISDKAKGFFAFKSLRNIAIHEIQPLFAESKLFDLLLISLCAGFCEELLFRGVLQVKCGIFIASIIFGLVHFITPLYFISATVIGFYLGYLFIIYKSLIVPIQMHFIYDFILLVYLRYFFK